jgi:RNA polymerase sigma factor (sigma-70 family)
VLINLPKPRTFAARGRPPREQVEPVALELVRRYGGDIMATARRYSASREDAEVAYQRGLEILLTKAPSTSADVLVPWLKTVVKHEAYSLHRQRERAGQATAPELLAGAASAARSAGGAGDPASPHEQAERLERLQIGAEALGRLKPQEIRCMLLLAEGHSYKQICEITGFSYTKVNRCLTEGRRSFLRGVERIESGAECERLAPLLSALADGEATARDMATLRPHLRTCLSCRAALRDAREVPARVAALAPIGLLAGGHASSGSGVARTLGGWINERLTAVLLRGQEVVEAASSHKLAAAAASAAALGGGGIATVEVSGPHGGGSGGASHRPAHVVVARPTPAPPALRWRPAAASVMPRTARRVHAPVLHQRRKPHRHPHPHRVVAPREQPPTGTSVTPPGAIEPAGPARPPERGSQTTRPSQPATGEFGP